ncbi:hypothetical protein ACVGOW_13555 [Pseudonocardia saturnea]
MDTTYPHVERRIRIGMVGQPPGKDDDEPRQIRRLLRRRAHVPQQPGDARRARVVELGHHDVAEQAAQISCVVEGSRMARGDDLSTQVCNVIRSRGSRQAVPDRSPPDPEQRPRAGVSLSQLVIGWTVAHHCNGAGGVLLRQNPAAAA